MTAEFSAVIDGTVRFEHLDPWLAGPTGEATFSGTGTPRLSWRIKSDVPEWRATAYELQAHGRDRHERVVVPSSEQVLVPWPFPPMRSRERVEASVRVADTAGEWSAWSEPATVEAGLFEQTDWQARWITAGRSVTTASTAAERMPEPAPEFVNDFEVTEAVASARLYITSLGIFSAKLGDKRISDERFGPGWTPYDSLLRYRVYDVTDHVVVGHNRLSVALGNGWYRGRIASQKIHRGAPYGDRLGLLAQLELTMHDGSRIVIGTDETWRSGTSGILFDDFYDGQTTDLRIAEHQADGASSRAPVALLDAPQVELTAPVAPPVGTLDEFEPISLHRSPRGNLVVDAGRNIVGVLRLQVRGRPGDEVVVQHAEVLENGELCTRPLRSALATDRYLLTGGDDTLEPEFTFHGFRYASISGIAEDEIQRITVVQIGTRNATIGSFATSDAALNTLHDNVIRSAEGNFLDIPTDCPQRDERLGWTGDIQVFAPTASALFDVAGFLTSWLESLVVEQLPDGTVPLVVPNVLPSKDAVAGWGDAVVVVPTVLHERFGDLDLLRRMLQPMCAWVDRLAELAGDDLLVSDGGQLGDWLDPLAPPEDPAASQADPRVVATAYLARSARLLSDAAELVDEPEKAARYGALADRVTDAFVGAYVADDGTILSDCQTVYALALAWDLLDGSRRDGAAARLRTIVRERRHTIATGFLGTPVILDALVKADAIDDAYAMLQNHAFPSWLYAVDLGATTMWERWDSMLPDGSINSGSMTSFNHYAFGAVADWMHRHISGLTPTSPGYRTVRIEPRPSASLDHGSVEHRSPYGWIRARWSRQESGIRLEIELPVGVRAEVVLPGLRAEVGNGTHAFDSAGPMSPSLAAASVATTEAE